MLSVQSGFSDYVWSTGETTPQILVLSPGSYCVTAVSDYCTIDRCISVAPCKLDIKLPNAITPSKLDGHNDYFSIDESQQRLIQDFEISIYNRWSNLVFYSDQKDFKWDGRKHLNNANKQCVFICHPLHRLARAAVFVQGKSCGTVTISGRFAYSYSFCNVFRPTLD